MCSTFHNRALAAGAALVASAWLSGCPKQMGNYDSADDAHRAVCAAAADNDLEKLYLSLDKKTQWSLMSALHDYRQIREIVRKHYPQARRARELRRTQLAAQSKNARDFFAGLAGQDPISVLAPLTKGSSIDGRKQQGDLVIIRSGTRYHRYCLEDSSWKYCGLRGYADQLKVRAARDLEVARENAEAFKRGG